MAGTKKVRADELEVGMVLAPGIGGGNNRNGSKERAVVVEEQAWTYLETGCKSNETERDIV